MALNSNSLTTVANCKSQLDIPTATTTYDSYIERLINSASEQIERYCNRKLKSTSYTHYFDGNLSNEILLKQMPVTSISSVYVDHERTFGVDTLIPATDYGIIDDSILRKHSGNWNSGSQIIKVTYTAGFTTVPSDIEDACIMLVEMRYRYKNERLLGKNNQSKQGESVSYTDDWPKQVFSQLQPYKIIVFNDTTMARNS